MRAPYLPRARWTRSSYSTGTGNCVEAAAVPAHWTRSSYSTSTGNCVEVGPLTHALAVRDSKDPDGPALVVPAAHFAAFVRRFALVSA